MGYFLARGNNINNWTIQPTGAFGVKGKMSARSFDHQSRNHTPSASDAFRIDDRRLIAVFDRLSISEAEMSCPGAVGQCCRVAFTSYESTFSPCLCLRSLRWG